MRPNQLLKTSSPSCFRSWSLTRCQRSRSVLVMLACFSSSKLRVQPSNSGEAGPTMPALANATDIVKGVARVRSVDRSPDRGRRVQPLGLVAPGRNVEKKGVQLLCKDKTPGTKPPAASAKGWIVVIMPPPPSLPVRWLSLTAASEVLRDRQKPPVFFTCFTTPISRLSRREFSPIVTSQPHAVRQSSPPTHFSMSLKSTRL